MKIYIIYRGPFGEQMINNIALKGFGDNIINLYKLKPETIEDEHNTQENIWEKIWEEPEKYIPKDLPIEKCDLLLVLGIHSKLGDLIPPIAERLGVEETPTIKIFKKGKEIGEIVGFIKLETAKENIKKIINH